MATKDSKRSDPSPARGQGLKNSLVALGSAAVFTVYAAGYERTAAAASRFGNDSDDGLPIAPGARAGVRPLPPPAAAPSAEPTIAATSPAPESSTTAPKKSAAPKPAHAETSAAQRTDSSASAPVVAANPAPQATPAPVVTAPVAPEPTAPAPAVAIDSATKAANDTGPKPLKDGTFTGWGTSRHGDIQATVMVKNGRITFAAISECLTQYSCSWISALPPQVIARQSADVDYVSGATQSTRAFYYAVVEALSKAK